jgi:hypothetical protein
MHYLEKFPATQLNDRSRGRSHVSVEDRFYEKARHVKITGLQVRFLHGVFSNGFGLCGTDVLSAGLTTSFPAVNKITSLGSIGRVGDTEKGLWDFGRPSLKKMIDFIAHLAEAAEQH